MKKQPSNKGRITRADQAWGPAHREYIENDRAARIDAVHGNLRKLVDLDHAEALIDLDIAASPGTDLATIDAPQSPSSLEVIPATQSLAVPLKFIQAALITAGKDDIRYYMNGVYLHAVNGELRICGTDGHRLIASRFKPEKGVQIPEWAEAGMILPGNDLAQALPLLAKNGVMGNKWEHAEPHVLIEHVPDSDAVTLRSWNGFATFKMKPVDGKFPDYAKILEQTGTLLAGVEREVMETSAFNTAYIRGATDVAAKLGAKAIHSFTGTKDQAALFTFDGAPDTVLIIMPMRAGDAVSDGAIKLLGSGSVNASIAALKAHATRTTKLLESVKGDRERQDLQNRREGFNARIAHLLELSGKGPKRLEHREAA